MSRTNADKPASGDPASPTTPAKDPKDERNLVEVDDAFAEASFDDRLWLWWQRNAKAMLYGAVTAIIVAGAFQGYRLWQEAQVNARQEAYREAVGDTEALLAFGNEHPGTTLGALALLTVADERFEAGAFGEAAELYRSSLSGFTDLPYQGRAQLGEAVSLLRQGGDSATAGAALLEQLASDPATVGTLRAEAAFQRAVYAVDTNDFDAARRFFDLVAEVDTTGVWQQQAQRVREALPQLEAPESESEPVVDDVAEEAITPESVDLDPSF